MSSPHLTYPLCALLRIRPQVSRNIRCFTGKGYWPFAQPPTWRARCCNSSDLSPGTCPARLNLPGTTVPADIASRVIKVCKPPHQDKVQHLRRRLITPLFLSWFCESLFFETYKLVYFFLLIYFLPAQLASTSLRYMRVVHVIVIVNY